MSAIDFQQLARGFRESVGFHWRPPFEVVILDVSGGAVRGYGRKFLCA